MEFFKQHSAKPIHLVLGQDRVRSLKRGHPWVFSKVLKDLPDAVPGSLAVLKDKEGEIVAKGLYDPEGPIGFRAFALGKERLDSAFIEKRFEQALAWRKTVINQDTTGFRLFNGEGDGLPGLVCDIFDDCAVFKLDGAGPEGFWNIEQVSDWVSKKCNVKSCYLKFRTDREEEGRFLKGKLAHGVVQFKEHGLKFETDIIRGQKTGFFLDQRDNRKRIGMISKNKKVLNLFGYTGGFSIYAGAAGSKKVTTVDLAKPAIKAAEANWTLNEFPAKDHEAIACDAFEYLEQAKSKQATWDVVIVDPPSFAPSKESAERAAGAYKTIFAAAAQVTENGGILAPSSCSSHISFDLFLEIIGEALAQAKRRGTFLGVYGQPEDHPFPVACHELRYLKFALVRVEKD